MTHMQRLEANLGKSVGGEYPYPQAHLIGSNFLAFKCTKVQLFSSNSYIMIFNLLSHKYGIVYNYKVTMDLIALQFGIS